MKTDGYDIARDHILKHRNIIEVISSNTFSEQVKMIGHACVDVLKNGNKILLMGNGGSAADAQHLAAELVGRYMIERKPYRAIALTTDTSILTAVSNDYSYAEVFERQVEAIGSKRDILIGFSTSGKSKNIINGLKKGRELGLVTVAIVGEQTFEVKPYSDYILSVPSDYTPIIQEVHIMAGHIICSIIEINT